MITDALTLPDLHAPPSERYKSFNVHNFRSIPQVQEYLTESQRFAIDVVSRILPFKTNQYVVDHLIDWDRVPNDPIYVLNFPQRDMLSLEHFDEIANLLRRGAPKALLESSANAIRYQLNPHPAGQLDHNVPMLDGVPLTGMQHKYRETVLFFPSQGQTCHAYCTFCFRWPQFVGMDELKFAMRETDLLVEYLRRHPEVTNVLITGGDPMIMSTKILRSYIEPLLDADLPNLRVIRIGTKSLAYWPQRFVTDKDADDVLDLFQEVADRGKHLAIMAHFNHPNELKTDILAEAVRRVRQTGAQIRTQSPIMANINDDADAWAEMWRLQMQMGMVPYYMFIARDTGAHDYFSVPLVKSWRIFRDAYSRVSGVARTVRGPSMSAHPGKIQVLGVTEVAGERVLALQMLQGRNPEWVMRPFFARYDPEANWIDELSPAFEEDKFFFEDALDAMYAADSAARAPVHESGQPVAAG